MTQTTTPTAYTTSDLNLSGFLLTTGQPLLGVSRDGRRCVFAFPAQAQEVAPSYYAGAMVPARAFANALRDLKALISET